MAERDNNFFIDLLQLQEGKAYEYDFHIDSRFFADRDNTDITGADVDVHLTVKRVRDSYSLFFECDGNIQAPCDRCLDPVDIPIADDYDLRLTYGDEFDDSNDDVIVIPYSWTKFDVAPAIYDTLILAVPLRCVHPDGQCNPEMTRTLDELGANNIDDTES